MLSKFFMTACSAAVVVLLTPSFAFAETVVEKVARTGVLTAGVRFGAVPYSYVDNEGNLVGYSIDVLKLIEDQLEAELGKDILVNMVPADTETERIPMLRSGEIDIACDSQFTWARARSVDFSVSYSNSGIRVLTRVGSDISTSESLAGRNVAVFEDSISKGVLAQAQPAANLLTVSSIDAAFAALDEERVEAIAGDTIFLGGAAAQRGGDEKYQLALEQPLDRYGVACMMPQGNSTFRYMVDYSIAGLAQGYLSGESRYVDIIDNWFGETGVVPLPQANLDDFFESVLANRALVPPPGAEAVEAAAESSAPSDAATPADSPANSETAEPETAAPEESTAP